MASGPIATILARLGDCISVVPELGARGDKSALLLAGLLDVRAQLQDALKSPDIGPDAALAKALQWLEKGVDGEVWNAMRALANEVQRLRPLAEASTALAQREREFAQNCERVMAGMEVEVAALTKAKREAGAEVDRLTSGLNRIATDYDYSAAGKVAKQLLGITDAAVPGSLPEVPST